MRNRAEDFRLPLDRLRDPKTLAFRFDIELDANKPFASFVRLVNATARKRPIVHGQN